MNFVIEFQVSCCWSSSKEGGAYCSIQVLRWEELYRDNNNRQQSTGVRTEREQQLFPTKHTKESERERAALTRVAETVLITC